MATFTMADLLAKEQSRNLKLERNQEIEGTVIAVNDADLILDLGSKSEGVLSRKDLSPAQEVSLKTGDTISAFVVRTENESGQVVLSLNRAVSPGRGGGKNWDKFINAKKENRVFRGKALEINRGGLIVELDGVRGFLPSSQVNLSQASKIDEMVGKDLQVMVIEVDPGQNRLILTQKTNVPDDVKAKLAQFKIGDKVSGAAAAILPFGIFAKLDGDVEGLVHISELSWEKVEDPGSLYKQGDEISGVVVSVDINAGRLNFSVKQASSDPFAQVIKDISPEDVVKATVTKVSSIGVSVELESLPGGEAGGAGIEGLIHSSKMEADMDYPIGKPLTCLVDSIDLAKRRVNLVPFVTSTKDLIYK